MQDKCSEVSIGHGYCTAQLFSTKNVPLGKNLIKKLTKNRRSGTKKTPPFIGRSLINNNQ